jgi:hypothetical protein
MPDNVVRKGKKNVLQPRDLRVRDNRMGTQKRCGSKKRKTGENRGLFLFSPIIEQGKGWLAM